MRELYNLVPLSTVVKINSGIALPKIFKNIEKSDGEIPFYKVAQMNNDTKIMKCAELRFTEEESKKFKIKLFPKGSVLIPKRGGAILTNKKRLLTEVASYDSNIMGLKADNKILTDEFLMIYMDSITLADYIDTSTIPQINNKHIDLMKISLPPLKEQKRIVAKLDKLFAKIDKAIALHQQNIDETEALMGAVLDEVFRELEERYCLSSINAIIQKTKNLKPKNDGEKYFTYIDISSINNEHFIVESPKKILGKDAPSRAKKEIIEGDIVYATTRPNLKNIALINQKYENPIASTGFCVLRINNKAINKFLFFYLLTNQLFEQIESNIRGAQYPAISDRDLKNCKIPLPPLKIQQKTVQYLEQISAKVEALKKEQKDKMQSLKDLKASILDKAFRGGI